MLVTIFVLDAAVVELLVFIDAEFEPIDEGDSLLEFNPWDDVDTPIPPLPLLPPSAIWLGEVFEWDIVVAAPETVLVDTLVAWSPPIWLVTEPAIEPDALVSDEVLPESLPPKTNNRKIWGNISKVAWMFPAQQVKLFNI